MFNVILFLLQQGNEAFKMPNSIPNTTDVKELYVWIIGLLLFITFLAIKYIYKQTQKNYKNYSDLKEEFKEERNKLENSLTEKNEQLEEKNTFIIENFEKNTKLLMEVLGKNNFLLENNTKAMSSLEQAINNLRDTTMNSLLHLRDYKQ